MRSWLILVALCAAVPVARADDFWARWGDGKAEVDGYSLVEPRYGAPRDGSAVLIFVTEDFSDSARVKADPGKHPASDVYPVLKLNSVRAFQTGVYRYHVMTSTFARTEWPAGGAQWPVVKSSHSMQEWCGHVYMQWVISGGQMTEVTHSYFDGEADATRTMAYPPGGVLEEELPVLVRGLRGDWLAPGQSRTVPYLPSAMRARFGHQPQQWGEATISRSPAVAGKKAPGVWTVQERGGETLTFAVEVDEPHRLLSWSSSAGERATLTGTARIPYWKLNGPGGEKALEQLGVTVPQAGSAP